MRTVLAELLRILDVRFSLNKYGLLALDYIRGSKPRAEAAAASANKDGVASMIQDYKLAQN